MEMEMEGEGFDSLPPEIIKMILGEGLPEFMHLVCRFVCVKWRNCCPRSSTRPRLGTAFSWDAAEEGHFELLKWAKTMGCSFEAGCASASAHGGHLELTKWLVKEKGCLGTRPP